MLSDMETILERIVDISEILVTGLFFKLKSPLFPMHIEEIPVERRNPDCCVRYRVVPSFAPPDIEAHQNPTA